MTGRTTFINPDNFLKARNYSVGSILDLGAGNIKLADTTVDINPDCKPDVVYDLEEFPYPFEDNSYDTVWAVHVIEHLENDKKAVEEIRRIAKERVVAIVPIGYRNDPDHKREFNNKEEAVERYKPDRIDISGMGGLFDLVMVW